MSHYYEQYNEATPEMNHQKALYDIKQYLGKPRFKKICAAVHADQTVTRAQFIVMLAMLVGIEGFPAEAWATELGLTGPDPEPMEVIEDPASEPLMSDQDPATNG